MSYAGGVMYARYVSLQKTRGQGTTVESFTLCEVHVLGRVLGKLPQSRSSEQGVYYWVSYVSLGVVSRECITWYVASVC